jgi:hypothetical protein
MTRYSNILLNSTLSGTGYQLMELTPINEPYEKEVLIIKSHVKTFLKERGVWVKSETFRTINDTLIDLLEKAIVRTKLSKRKTVAPQHV